MRAPWRTPLEAGLVADLLSWLWEPVACAELERIVDLVVEADAALFRLAGSSG
jgi:hypothetical protein